MDGIREAHVGIQRIAVLLAIAFLGAQAGAQQGASKPDRFAALRFLAGTCHGDSHRHREEVPDSGVHSRSREIDSSNRQ